MGIVQRAQAEQGVAKRVVRTLPLQNRPTHAAKRRTRSRPLIEYALCVTAMSLHQQLPCIAFPSC